MATKWLHLSEITRDPWVLPIWAAVHEAAKRKPLPPISKELSEIAIHVSIRLNILPRIAARLNEETKALYDAATKHKPEHVFTAAQPGVAMPMDDDLKYKLIADIDAFLFEVNACAELMAEFFERLHEYAGSLIPEGTRTEALHGVLAKSGISGDWFKSLDRDRNFVAHKGTPYVAVDISTHGTWELLIMKENLLNFDQSEKFFTLSELQAIERGFTAAKASLQEHLIGLFK